MDNPSTPVAATDATPATPIAVSAPKKMNRPLMAAGVVIVVETLIILYLLFNVLNLTIRVRKLEGGSDTTNQQQQQGQEDRDEQNPNGQNGSTDGTGGTVPTGEGASLGDKLRVSASPTEYSVELDYDAEVGPVVVVKVINTANDQVLYTDEVTLSAENRVTTAQSDIYYFGKAITLSSVASPNAKLEFELYERSVDAQGQTSDTLLYRQSLN